MSGKFSDFVRPHRSNQGQGEREDIKMFDADLLADEQPPNGSAISGAVTKIPDQKGAQ